MSEGGKIARVYGRGMLLQLIPVGCFMLYIALWCSGTILAAFIDPDLMAAPFWLGFLALPVVGLVIGVGGGLAIRSVRMRPFNEALDWLGPGRAYMLSGRQWSGAVGGRPASAKVARAAFWMTLSGQPKADIRAGRDNALARLIGSGWHKRSLEGGVIVLSKDAEVLDSLVDAPGAATALERLLANDGRSLRALHIDPKEGVTLTLRHVGEVRAREWFDDLATIAAISERG